MATVATSAAAAERVPDPGMTRLAALATAELRPRLAPALTTVLLAPIGAKESEGFTPALERALRNAGYAVATDAKAAPNAQRVAFAVTPAFGGYVVQLEFDGEATTRLYRPDATGKLVSAGPATVRVQ